MVKDSAKITDVIAKKMAELDALNTKVDEAWYQFDAEYKRMLPARAALDGEYQKLCANVERAKKQVAGFKLINDSMKEHPDYSRKQKILESNDEKYATWNTSNQSMAKVRDEAKLEIDDLEGQPGSDAFTTLDVEVMRSLADRSEAVLDNLIASNKSMETDSYSKERQNIGDADLYEITNDKTVKREVDAIYTEIQEIRDLLQGDDKQDLSDQMLKEVDEIEAQTK